MKQTREIERFENTYIERLLLLLDNEDLIELSKPYQHSKVSL